MEEAALENWSIYIYKINKPFTTPSHFPKTIRTMILVSINVIIMSVCTQQIVLSIYNTNTTIQLDVLAGLKRIFVENNWRPVMRCDVHTSTLSQLTFVQWAAERNLLHLIYNNTLQKHPQEACGDRWKFGNSLWALFEITYDRHKLSLVVLLFLSVEEGGFNVSCWYETFL